MLQTVLNFASHPASQPALRVALVSGGDERLALDPRTGRNRYGTPPHPAPGEIHFSSSTASPISPRGLAAADAAFARLLGGDAATASAWMDGIRTRLLDLYGIPGAEVILTASGTEAELVLLTLAQKLLTRPLRNIVVAPGETGSGVTLAAGGRHFLDSAPHSATVGKGAVLDGMAAGDVEVVGVPIRDAAGAPLGTEKVDNDVLRCAEMAFWAGRDVVVHCLDASKTGLSGFARDTAATLKTLAGGRCVVVVDACQLRCSAEAIRRDLDAGFFVSITGSKFAGGPPFSGALLVPPDLVERLGAAPGPAGLSAYTARNDWPARLRTPGEGFGALHNIGLGLRWEAALAELEAYAIVDPALSRTIAERFAARVAFHVAATPGLRLLPPRGEEPADRPRTILPIATTDQRGEDCCARTLHRALMTPDGDAGAFHVGQPVEVGPRWLLRVCLGAPHIVDVAARYALAPNLDAAMAPLAADLRALFARWAALRETDAALAQRRA